MIDLSRPQLPNFKYYVGPEGPRDAKLAIVAEKPAKDEVAQGRPLIGPTGQMLMHYLNKVGLKREDVYLTNSVKHFDSVGNPSNDDIRREQPLLFRELADLHNLNCIVALGNSALVALSNFHYNDITARRGSKLLAFNRKKMVPTFHTSYVVQGNWEMGPVVEFDLARAKKESVFPEIRRPSRYYNVMPRFDEALDWLDHVDQDGEWLSFDIETRRAGPHMNWYISTFGFASDPKEGFCIPLTYQNRRSYWPLEQECILWRRIQKILNNQRKRYVTQNGLFDCWHLWRNGVLTPHMAKGFDTMYAHRYLAADLPHALHFLVSIYTEEEYYKDESGKHEAEERVSDEQFQVYNAKDAAITLEVAFGLIEDLSEYKMYDYYMAQKQSQWDVLHSMRASGFRVDKTKKQFLLDRFAKQRLDTEQEILAREGWVPNTKSPIHMAKIFDKYGIRPNLTKIEKRPVLDEEHLLIYAQKWPAARPTLTNCITINQQRTMLSSYALMTTDPKGFYHAQYDLSKAVSGRLASEGASEGHLLPKKRNAGPQMQNQPRFMRGMFIPDDPELDEITNFDFTQAEPHVVAWDSNDTFYINALLSGKDVHRIAGLVIFKGYNPTGSLPSDELIASIPKTCDKCKAANESDCAHSERYLAKRCKNGIAYNMKAPRLMSVLRGENIFILKDLAELIVKRVRTEPLVAWHDTVAAELKSRWLVNIYGTKKEVFGLIDDAALRDALSWKAQSAVTHLTCHAMRVIHEDFVKTGRPGGIRTQTHDSCTISHRRRDREEVVDLINRATYLPVLVHGRELVIPHEVTHGPSWGEQTK